MTMMLSQNTLCLFVFVILIFWLGNSESSSEESACSRDYYDGCPSDCNSLHRSYSGRSYCNCDENTYCSDECGSGRFKKRNGCQQCESNYFKRDYSSPCVSCSSVFMDTCEICSDFEGCTQCKDGYNLILDESCGLSNVDFYYCQPDTCDNNELEITYDYVENSLDVIPRWLYGRNAVGTRHDGVAASDVFLKDDMSVLHRKTERFPLPCASVWTVLDIYKDFQSAVPTHTETEHYSGPINEVGEIIRFQAVTQVGNFEVFEELSMKDNDHYIWQIKLPFGGNIYFTEYFYTLRLYEDVYIDPESNEITQNESCLAMTDMEYRFQNYLDANSRSALMAAGKANLQVYNDFIYEYSLEQLGVTVEGTLTVDVPIDWLFEYISNPNSTDWILLYDDGSLDVLQPDIRSFTINDGASTLLQRIHSKDETTYEIIWEILSYRVFNILAFREEYRLTQISETQTEMTAVFRFVPKYDNTVAYFSDLFQSAIDGAVAALPSVFLDIYLNE